MNHNESQQNDVPAATGAGLFSFILGEPVCLKTAVGAPGSTALAAADALAPPSLCERFISEAETFVLDDGVRLAFAAEGTGDGSRSRI